MNVTERKLIMVEAIHKYGNRNQMEMAIEEMSELIKEICKNFRGEKNIVQITEEIADVRITIEQLCMILGIDSSNVDNWMDIKMNRLRKRMGEEDAR